ncbi:diguanylate cyclase (GGDEF) domain-containing protein [Klenkia marina]|uniref:Diguanylate cyclase (GGDEF) domain-containing protein n=1 Tax=Klenkia marina TaxID=1960309 RepID=A0A1G4YAJ0_9ACTN|nr:GGDEF domain-containing protein [Klenkia marina]SCX50454.1 diguanylate cyclase (GGDEF) domain-containing protein [Klenkia marina]
MPAALNPRSARLVDPAQEDRFLATQLPGLRRDVQLVAGLVLAYNAVFFVVNLVRGPAWGLVALSDHVVVGTASVVLAVLVRRTASYRTTARALVGGFVVYAVVALALGGDRTPTGWVLLSLQTAAVLCLHARLPFPVTATLVPAWSVASLLAASTSAVDGRDLTTAVAMVASVNLVGLAAAHRVAAQARLLFAQTEELARLSSHDPVTGLPNRRAWESALTREWARAARTGTPLGLVLVDVDHFKQLNEAFGHPGGDRALEHVAGLLRGTLRRPGDLAARLGGDEFGLLLPGTDDAGAGELATGLLTAARELRAGADADDPASGLTLSLGVHGAHPEPGSDVAAAQAVADAVAVADAALFRAKADGRDRVADAG